ncbi:hypothetical protein BJ741DRAFT_611605, partial [Chytriomyces cf. hyalinus JEL632]
MATLFCPSSSVALILNNCMIRPLLAPLAMAASSLALSNAYMVYFEPALGAIRTHFQAQGLQYTIRTSIDNQFANMVSFQLDSRPHGDVCTQLSDLEGFKSCSAVKSIGRPGPVQPRARINKPAIVVPSFNNNKKDVIQYALFKHRWSPIPRMRPQIHL